MLAALENGFMDGVYVFGIFWGMLCATVVAIFALGLFSGTVRMAESFFRFLFGRGE